MAAGAPGFFLAAAAPGFLAAAGAGFFLVILAFPALLDVVSGSGLAVGWLDWMKADSDTGGKCWSMLEA